MCSKLNKTKYLDFVDPDAVWYVQPIDPPTLMSVNDTEHMQGEITPLTLLLATVGTQRTPK
jgi:hypothetical protein